MVWREGGIQGGEGERDRRWEGGIHRGKEEGKKKE